ncbi:ferric reductase-like protein transmembrane component 4 [Boeremia exigua]|uniref:ferric reductase-like protein transmembrane component 4 n=1 Tax=Boeremia exigua TaxID=749465 RepID=UPI001E8D83F1|nr:ferric reductase-like protein transmembrane component 4 [Boeremia exigua]KAH6614345.1 ferric reductase-like protein transmembrane component 4 [Boeremia exigua]
MVLSTYYQAIPTLLALCLHISNVDADGTGLIGYGKTLYNPTCTFACRIVIRRQPLACTPVESHGKPRHSPQSDHTFLKTMALCIDTYCSLSDEPATSLIEDYWDSHLGIGTLGTYQYVPVMSYQESLLAARDDEQRARAGNMTTTTATSVPEGLVPFKVSSPLALTTGGSGALNSTRLVGPVQWQFQYNYLSDFEVNERGHSTMTIIIAVVAIALPILLSALRDLPGLTSNRNLSRLKSALVHSPAIGRHHRQPVTGGLVPTRGQSLYIFLIVALNIILLVAPYTYTQPQASFTTKGRQQLSVIGNRAGTMAMGNTVALFLFSSRNNVLLYLTDWSYGTYLLLHRWLGYCAVAQTVIHSAMLWRYYVVQGTYSAELLRLYWQWGIVSTVAICALIPCSLLIVRQKLYEFFVASHVVPSLLFLIGYYYHIWYVYTYNWGYEIWMFVAAGTWACERLLRVIQIALHGTRTATVSVIADTDSEYIRIDIEGKRFETGVAYLCFPTLSWRFWETHPFSVSGVATHLPSQSLRPESSLAPVQDVATEKELGNLAITSVTIAGAGTTTFFARTRGGITKTLMNRASGSETRRTRVRVLVEGPYDHSGQAHLQIAQCSSILCIAGGVGITACLLLLRHNEAKDSNLFWSSRHPGLVAELTPTLDAFHPNVRVETLVGQRFNLVSLIRRGSRCIWSPGMADEVRLACTQIAWQHRNARAYVFIDEAFSW